MALDFLGLIVSKLTRGVVPVSFVSFLLVGGVGVVLHLAALKLALLTGLTFFAAQTLATLVAMACNFVVNNLTTYRNARLRGWAWLRGLAMFCGICSLSALANIGVATWLFEHDQTWWAAGLPASSWARPGTTPSARASSGASEDAPRPLADRPPDRTMRIQRGPVMGMTASRQSFWADLRDALRTEHPFDERMALRTCLFVGAMYYLGPSCPAIQWEQTLETGWHRFLGFGLPQLLFRLGPGPGGPADGRLRHGSAQRGAAGDLSQERRVFRLLLPAALPAALLSACRVSYFAALAAWLAPAMAACFRSCAAGPAKLGYLHLMCFPAAPMTIAHGQNAFITTALLGSVPAARPQARPGRGGRSAPWRSSRISDF